MAGDTAQPTATKTEPAKGRGKKKATKKKSAKKSAAATKFGQIGYPKHPILKCLRIPQGVVENNAGKECTDREAAKFAGLGWGRQLKVEISSAIKYSLFERPSPGHVKPTDLIRRILKPQTPTDKVDAIREAVLKAPGVSDIYKHYRGENRLQRGMRGQYSAAEQIQGRAEQEVGPTLMEGVASIPAQTRFIS